MWASCMARFPTWPGNELLSLFLALIQLPKGDTGTKVAHEVTKTTGLRGPVMGALNTNAAAATSVSVSGWVGLAIFKAAGAAARAAA